jgi:hypothetical protein
MGLGLNLTPSQANGLVKSAKALNKADAINMAIQIVGEVGVKYINTIYAIKNEKERQQIIADLDKLDNEQISELLNNLDRINETNARIREISSYVSKVVSQKASQEITGRIKKQNLGNVMSDRKKIYIGIGVTLAIFLTIIVVKRITK